METGVSEVDSLVDEEAKVAEGLRLIEDSCLSKRTKQEYGREWRHWGSWCGDVGVDPLDATWEDVVKYIRSGRRPSHCTDQLRVAVAWVYHSRGAASPSNDRRVGAAFGKKLHTSHDSYCEITGDRLSVFRSEYLGWCRLRGRKPGPASGEQVVEFLSSVGEHLLAYDDLRLANTAVSLYLAEEGHPSTETHPLVVALFKELRGKWLARQAEGASGDGKRLGEKPTRWKRQWETWREHQGIERGRATVADVLDYLGQHEHFLQAGQRAIGLRNACGGEEEAFLSQEVQDWLDGFLSRLERGEVPGALTLEKIQPVLDEWAAARSARAGAELRVPVGLTREEVERRRVGEGRQLEPITLRGYAYVWANFSEWMKRRGTRLEEVEPVHVRVYLQEGAKRMMVSSLRNYMNGIAFGFEEHGFLINPAVADEVVDYLKDLEVERKEGASQVDPIRETEFNLILESAFKPRSMERMSRAELRGATTVSLVRIMFDGLLRGSDAYHARWSDLSRSGDGSGSLLLRRSKTDKYGRGECTYVSAVAFQYLDLMRDLKRFYKEGVQEDDPIFGIAHDKIGLFIRKACADAGLVGRFGTHSMRIGGAQALAHAGFSLPMIMLAGRWSSPDQPNDYIRNIMVLDSAMAVMQRMVSTGKHRLGPDARGIDVMFNYDLVRLAR